jgi:hypothetical protein
LILLRRSGWKSGIRYVSCKEVGAITHTFSQPRLWSTRYQRLLRRNSMQLSMLLLKPTRLGLKPPSSGGSRSCFSKLASTSIVLRADVRLQHLIREHMPDIAKSIVLEQGKTFADAQGDVHRGLQVVEAATAITSNMLGDKLEVTKDMDTYSRRLPLGVCAAITPFNFPAM